MKVSILATVAAFFTGCLVLGAPQGLAAGASAGVGGVAPAAPPEKSEEKPAPKGEAARKEAEKLITSYLSGPEASLQERAAIKKLINDMGSDDFRVREAASRNILKYGEKALLDLKRARESKDPEIASRAETAISSIRRGDRKGEIVAALRRIRKPALAAIDARIAETQKTSAAAKKEAGQLQARGESEASLKKLAEAKKCVERALVLAGLRKQVEREDDLAEIKELLKKGKTREAVEKLRRHLEELQKAGKLTPAKQKEYQELFMQMFKELKLGGFAR
jgi:hypothetical protein